MEWYIEKETEGMLIRQFLIDKLTLSNRLIKRLKAHDRGIVVNGEEKTVRHVLQQGETLRLQFPPEKISAFMQPENIRLHIVYEDEHVLVIQKRAGVATIPSYHHPSGTVANGILHYYKKQDIPYTVHIVTRLDRDTSGLLLVAKHQYSHSLLSNMQRNNGIKRTYQAIVLGHLEKKSGTIALPIGRKQNSIIERTVAENGQHAITHYKVVEEYDRHSLVEVHLETGRTHQIRVHFSHIGHPLLGDDLYGGEVGMIDRQALHCAHIQFVHPFTNERVTFSAELPEDMTRIKTK